MHSCGLSITRRRTSGAVITRASSADPRHHSPARHCPWRPRVGGESFLANAPSYQLLCARRTLIWPGADVRSCASQPPNDSKPFRAFAITDCSRYISHCVLLCICMFMYNWILFQHEPLVIEYLSSPPQTTYQGTIRFSPVLTTRPASLAPWD